MSAVGVFGILLGMLSLTFGMVERSNRKLGLFLALIVLHALTSVLYYLYVQDNDADTKLYYFDLYGFYSQEISLGTMFLVHLVQWLKSKIGGTYLDYFLLFQAVGVWGIALLLRTLEELTLALDRHWEPLLAIIVMVPGMFFWTSAIGKDAPLFFACSLAVWSTMALARRWIWFGIAIAVMLLFRPHVALVAVLSLSLALVTGRGISNFARLALASISAAAAYTLAGTVQDSLQIDLSSVGSIADYIENTGSVTASAAGEGGELINLPFPLKLASLLYRPFFFDAGGVFGLVASIQNLFMVYASYQLARNFGLWVAMFRESFPVRFATVFLGAMVLMLTVMYYNVGLGLRQREMFSPALCLIFGAVILVSRGRRVTADGHSNRLGYAGVPV
jgi:hypothetical protein